MPLPLSAQAVTTEQHRLGKTETNSYNSEGRQLHIQDAGETS